MPSNIDCPWDDDDFIEDFNKIESESAKSLQIKEYLKSPASIYSYLDSRLYSQIEYKKALSTFIYLAANKIKSQKILMVCGATGSGKSEMCRVVSEIYPNLVISSVADLVPSGYKGSQHVSTLLSRLDFMSEYPPILVLDEWDKLCNKATGNTLRAGSWADSSLLSEFLVIFDGKDAQLNVGTDEKPVVVNPKDMYFILLGSWSSLTDTKSEGRSIGFNAAISPSSLEHSQLTKEEVLEALPPEIQGRINRIVILKDFNSTDFYNILKSKKYSPATQIEEEMGIHIKVSSKRLHELAEESMKSFNGVRYARNVYLEQISEALFDNPDIKEVRIR